MDQADLYDHEVAEIGKIWHELQTKWSHKTNTKANLQEFAKEAHGVFLKAGFVVNIAWEHNLVVNPVTMEPYPIEVEVMGRVPGNEHTEDGVELHDHELHRWQVLNANQRGEKFYGQKEKPK